jgi:adenylate cyclase
MTEQRRLAAILVADVVGYSKLIGNDEAGTLALLEALRNEIIEPQIAKHAGRLFKAVGDGFLIEFASAVQAVSCAKAIQEANSQGRLQLRISIHVGDVVVQGDDLMGDGVNVAARIESLAEPGGIALSRQVHDQVRDKLDLEFVDKGEIALKNIQRPVQVFVIGGTKVDRQASALPLPDKPSIAVLPFQNMSGDPEQEYFADGVVEDIITALSRFKSLFVIARNSSFAYKGKGVDIKQVGRELGVRYVLEGSVRKAGGQLRITGQLIDCATGAHIWADRYAGNADDVFDLQDRVTLGVVGAITPKLEQADIARVARKPTEHMGAYDCYLRGIAAYHSAGEEGLKKAQAFCSQAIELDPGFAAPYAIAAFCQALRHGIGVNPTETERAWAIQLSRRAVELDRDDAVILSMATWVEAHLTRGLDAAADLAERAIAINPNLAFAWAASGWVHVWMGKPDIGLQHLLQARRLSPLDINQRFVMTGIAQAHFLLEQYDEAFAVAVRAVQSWRQAPTYRVAAASAALSGRLVEARRFVASLLEVDPGRRIATLEETLGAYRRAEDIQHLKRALQLAGLPE